MRDANASSFLDIYIPHNVVYVSPGFLMRTLTGGARHGIHTRYDTRKMRPTSRASVSLRAKWQVLYRVIPLLLRWWHGRCWIMMVECIPQTHVLILSMFWHIQTNRVSLYSRSTQEMHHSSLQKIKLPRLLLYHPPTFPKRTAYYDSMLCSFETNEPTASPYMYTHNTYRTALYTTSHCTKHVKYRMPLFLSHKRYYQTILPRLTIPTASRCFFYTNEPTSHLFISSTQTLRR